MSDDWEDDDWESAPTSSAPKRVPGFPSASGLSAPGVADVPDDWEDEDAVPEEDPSATAAAPKPSAPMKQSKRIALALKEREAAEQAAATARAQKREQEMAAMDEATRKMEMQRIVEEADLDNARDLFMGSSGKVTRNGPPDDENLHTANPVTDDELAKYATMLTDKCRKFNKDPRRTARYMIFVKEVMRGLTADLGADDAKELATHMGTLSNIKLEESKKAKGGKKKSSKKSNVRVGLDRADDIRDDAYAEPYDDFM